jgi:exosome complex component RRP42
MTRLYGRFPVSGWQVQVDVLVIAADGALVDIVSCAIRSALQAAIVPKIKLDEENNSWDISPHHQECVPLYSTQLPIWIAQHRIGSKFVVDASLEEELCATAQVLVAITPDMKVSGVVLAGSGAIAPSTLKERIHAAKEIAKQLFDSNTT